MSTAPFDAGALRGLALRHVRLGWIWLLVFATGGLLLEALHGFKVGLYLDVNNETRRLLWRLAHAHGVLLGLVNVAFAATLALGAVESRTLAQRVSLALITASVLLPAGFFLGGVVLWGADPGPGVILSPIGGGALLLALAGAVWGMRAGG